MIDLPRVLVYDNSTELMEKIENDYIRENTERMQSEYKSLGYNTKRHSFLENRNSSLLKAQGLQSGNIETYEESDAESIPPNSKANTTTKSKTK